MTGRELIIYILENGLENEEIISDDGIVGFMSITQAAVKFAVGTACIHTWIDIGAIPSVRIAGTYYIPANAENPMNKVRDEKDIEKNNRRIVSRGHVNAPKSNPNERRRDYSGFCKQYNGR